jgi:hypothetical protein
VTNVNKSKIDWKCRIFHYFYKFLSSDWFKINERILLKFLKFYCSLNMSMLPFIEIVLWHRWHISGSYCIFIRICPAENNRIMANNHRHVLLTNKYRHIKICVAFSKSKLIDWPILNRKSIAAIVEKQEPDCVWK